MMGFVPRSKPPSGHATPLKKDGAFYKSLTNDQEDLTVEGQLEFKAGLAIITSRPTSARYSS